MRLLTRRRRSTWATPIAAGTLIAAGVAVSALAGTNPFASGQHDIAFVWSKPIPLIVSDLLMIAATLMAAGPIVVNAVRALLARVISIDLLVSIAAIGALIIGQYWEAAAVTFLFVFGHALETGTMNRTRSALAGLVAVAPNVALVLRGGRQIEIPAGDVAVGETVLIKNGSQVPVDGLVTSGTGALDESSITGEPVPAEKVPGDRVFAGSVSRGGLLQVRATGIGADTTLARIIRRVEEAQDARGKVQSFMERFSAWYTPGIIVLALVSGLATGDVVLALTLLVVGCPGALVISIPVAIVAGIGRGAKDGILIKGGEYLETSARISAVALDKTGTLTEGMPRLTRVEVLDPSFSRSDVLGWAARAEVGSEHPLARPIVAAAEAEGVALGGLPDSTELVPGMGIAADVDGHRVVVGNLSLMGAEGISRRDGAGLTIDRLADLAHTPVAVAVDGVIVGIIAVADQPRNEAAEMISRLRTMGIKRIVMLTGDNRRVAEAVAAELEAPGGRAGIDAVYAELLPEDKLAIIERLRREGHTVAMVGDGVNDAPALATADIGVAMGAAGTAVAIETADIALMADDLLGLPHAIDLARRTVSVMRQNIAIALATVILLLAGIFLGEVSMAIGMLAHEASVLVVIANAMRLLRPGRRAGRQVDSADEDRRELPVGLVAGV